MLEPLVEQGESSTGGGAQGNQLVQPTDAVQPSNVVSEQDSNGSVRGYGRRNETDCSGSSYGSLAVSEKQV
jgi:hypothetical protein